MDYSVIQIIIAAFLLGGFMGIFVAIAVVDYAFIFSNLLGKNKGSERDFTQGGGIFYKQTGWEFQDVNFIKFCYHCGQKMPENAEICDRCGKSMTG